MQQAFVKNGDLTVEQYVAECAKAAGGAMKVVDFVRFEKGEGLQKRGRFCRRSGRHGQIRIPYNERACSSKPISYGCLRRHRFMKR